ncbi:hypothetical protein GCM10007382_18540 [Salinibacterium xinjiangense]|uniref:Uncharacterized protein n=1 Tax=Salinibacterium xinjiangense TaxID=386302 RepID=A0A2C8YRK6_9MICO|nr:hypothetical protein [Salinibacterium xinjiangense]GGK98641.1 hypothetical protein GCM10007382_18540 [Salinibacterium xinjiangense]SOE53136.1 hypothetical protein SAMN06296378_0509 [Salinibacterium xinjiangense]
MPSALKIDPPGAGVLLTFESLSASQQKALLAPREAAKTDATRGKNLAAAAEAEHSAAPAG